MELTIHISDSELNGVYYDIFKDSLKNGHTAESFARSNYALRMTAVEYVKSNNKEILGAIMDGLIDSLYPTDFDSASTLKRKLEAEGIRTNNRKNRRNRK